MEEQSQDELNGIKFVWNTLPATRQDSTKIVIPVGFHYTPGAKNESMQLLEYDPLTCPKCKAVISPLFSFSARAKIWECPFCPAKVSFPRTYADYITETNLPAELLPENTTVEYKLNKKESAYPTFIFLIDISVDEDELNELKESVQQTINNLPQDCSIGIITYGKMCNVHEIGYNDMPISYTLNGSKKYKPNEIQELLGLTAGRGTSNEGTVPKFIMPVSEVSFNVNKFLDDLEPDSWEKKPHERSGNCVGLALNTAMSILEATTKGEPARILVLMGNPGTLGDGAIVGMNLKETIRNFVDFELGNTNTSYYKPACEFYDSIAKRASRSGVIIDIFSCCLNQVGLYEMKNLVALTGGYMIFTDSFSTLIFKDSLTKIFELDENGDLKMCFKAKLEFNSTAKIKVSGALGHLSSMSTNSNTVSDIKIGQSGTNSWVLGGIDENSTYTFILDCNNPENSKTKPPSRCIIQLVTTYIAGDRTTRMRVTTVDKKIIPELNNPNAIDEIGDSFDQEAATVLLSRMCIDKQVNGEDPRDILKWIDKTLIRLVSKFSKYTPEDARSIKIPQKFLFFPQFMFYLRRSSFIRNFNESPDESIYYKSSLMREKVENCALMIQPSLFEFTADNPSSTPVFLDLNSMKDDCVLLLDTFFYLVVWRGIDVCKWRDEGYAEKPEYENIKQMMEVPEEMANGIVDERLPTPRYVSCDSGSGQERLLKCIVNPSKESKNNVMESGYMSDDVSLNVFMDHLKRLAVSP
ncbi:MAG: Sec23/Sec24 zinc finger-containing protein [archaeon]|nr:Sec23/Sec24 zinc finger-containing protein [archaeon]